MDRIFDLTFAQIFVPELLEPLLQAIISRIRTYDELVESDARSDLPKQLKIDASKRISLVVALAPLLEVGSHDATAVVHGSTRLCIPSDIPQFIAALREAPDGPGAAMLAYIIRTLFYIDFSYLDAILDALPSVPALQREMGGRFEAVEIESAQRKK